MLKSNRIDANFTEELVGFALESFLATLSFPTRRFSIEPFSRAKERWLGADARLHGTIKGFLPFYMQFKRPTAYPDYSSSRIIKERKQLALESAPRSLFFSLREKTKKQNNYQHNVLLRLRQHLQKRKIGDAAYVCPLFLDRSAYRLNMHRAGQWGWLRIWDRNPLHYDEVLINKQNDKILFDNLPILAEHVTIPPHDRVSSASHSYSFTESGKDICFHSPLSLPEYSNSLAYFLDGVADGFLQREDKIRPEDANEMLRSMIEYISAADDREFIFPLDEIDAGDPIGNWFAWGDYLRNEFEIDQYALVSWRL